MFEKTLEALKRKFSKGNTVVNDETINRESETTGSAEVAETKTSTLNKKGIVTIITALVIYVGAKFGYDMPDDTTSNIVDALCVIVLAVANWKK